MPQEVDSTDVLLDAGRSRLHRFGDCDLMRLCLPTSGCNKPKCLRKNAVFWDVTPCGSSFCFHIRSVRRLLVTANVVPSSLILVTLMMEALRSSETSVLTGATRRNIRLDGILIN
jgi:hypothetical protein